MSKYPPLIAISAPSLSAIPLVFPALSPGECISLVRNFLEGYFNMDMLCCESNMFIWADMAMVPPSRTLTFQSAFANASESLSMFPASADRQKMMLNSSIIVCFIP